MDFSARAQHNGPLDNNSSIIRSGVSTFALNFRRPSWGRPHSLEKPRDYVSPAGNPLPVAGKPSRPEERPTPGEAPRPEETAPKGPEKPTERPAAGKPSRTEEKPKEPEDTPKRGDQTPDSLDEDENRPGKIPDILSNIPLKEQCICELCTCG